MRIRCNDGCSRGKYADAKTPLLAPALPAPEDHTNVWPLPHRLCPREQQTSRIRDVASRTLRILDAAAGRRSRRMSRIYVFFPPIWQNPIKYIPKYYGKMAAGVTDIGVGGKKEVGNSGEGPSVVLDETIDEVGDNFYLTSLIMRFSVAGIALVLISVSVFLYLSLKGFVLTWWRLLKTRKLPKVFNYSASPG